MTKVKVNEFKSGLKVIFDNEPCIIIDNEYVKPGKGQAFNRVKIRKLLSSKVLEKTFRSSDSLKIADVVEVTLDYIYNDGKFYYFMNTQSFEQISADKKTIGNNAKWLVVNNACTLTLWNGNPIVVTPSNFVELKVIETAHGLRGDTQGTSIKMATLQTGAIVRVPLFISTGETIRVDTRSGEYVSRVKL
ncbi:elongation factor P [Candidatus Photodesmus blepharus]|uniref:Elongation factor P n=1 Tax=Candidatus Photodesmus blepharonis TaxID=1179155 RepID=A0A084CNJ1_9GAMM|nr:elongation factor P [Candidatus Photodesmus blepharus]KEY91370.1 elongation factor P [Candidatus Photodesmus blepharus]